MEKYKILQTGYVIACGVQIYKFEVDWMSSFQDMTYYYSIIGICLRFNYCGSKIILVIAKFLLLFLISFCPYVGD